MIGKGGSNLKSLVSRTLTKIHIPRQQGETEESQDEASVTITGDVEGVRLAKQEILDLVQQKVRNCFSGDSHLLDEQTVCQSGC